MFLAALLLALPQGPANLSWNPAATCVPQGTLVDIDLVLTADQPIQVGAIDALLAWDPLALEYVQASALGGQWLVSGFFPDPDGINLSLADGDGLFTLLANPSVPPSFPPTQGVARLRFRVLAAGQLALLPSSGQFGLTRVLGVLPGQDLTGNLGAPAAVGTTVGPASQIVRLGVPANPAVLFPDLAGGPRVGTSWRPRIDHSVFLPTALTDVLVVTQFPTNLFLPPYGTLLCLPPELLPSFLSPPGVPFLIPIPPKCGLVGLPLYTQGFSFDNSFAVELTSGLDIVLGSP